MSSMLSRWICRPFAARRWIGGSSCCRRSARTIVAGLSFVALICSAEVGGTAGRSAWSAAQTPAPEFIRTVGTFPDEKSSDYIVVTLSPNTGPPEMFNGTLRTTNLADISGNVVVIEAGSSLYGGLHQRFNLRPDLKEVRIYAKSLVIRDPLRLPGANVNIYTQTLRFEGSGLIDTTPLDHPIAAAQFANGLAGQSAGSIRVRAESVEVPTGTTIPRLIARGGKGQKGGAGRPGLPGEDLTHSSMIPLSPAAGRPYSNVWVFFADFPWLTAYEGPVVRANAATPQACDAAISAALQQPQSWPVPNPNATYLQVWNGSLGNLWWPGNGEDAQPGGRPGDGGSGGAIETYHGEFDLLVDLGGGQAGEAPAAQAGGAAGGPNPAVWITQIRSVVPRIGKPGVRFYCATHEHTSLRGRDSVPASASTGAGGSLVPLAGPDSQWVHPYFLRHVIAHGRDAYRLGHVQYAEKVFSEYLKALDDYGTPPEDFSLAFLQSRQELTDLLGRLERGLDFQGHRPGWAPRLTLGAYLTNFTHEVDSAVPTILLSLYLQSKASQNQKDVSALQESVDLISGELAEKKLAVNEALAQVPVLQDEAEQLATEIENLTIDLKKRETALLQRAVENVEDQRKVPDWKRAVRVLGTITQAAAVKFPVLAPVAAGLSLFANIDEATPWQTIEAFGGVVDQVASSKSKFKNLPSDMSAAMTDLDPENYGNLRDYAKALAATAKQVESVYRDTLVHLQGPQIPDSEVQKALAQLRAEDTVLNDLIDRVAATQTTKLAMSQTLERTLEAISTGTADISKDLLTLSALYDGLNSAVGKVDHAMVIAVRDMERGARERLALYQYLMAKAYEYRVLKSYPADLNLDSVVQKALTVIATDGYPVKPANVAAIKALYIDSVRIIVANALNDLQQRPIGRSGEFRFRLTPGELQQLNRTGELPIYLPYRVAGQPDEQNLGIVDIRATDLKAQVAGTVGPVGRVRLRVEHSGESIQTLDARRFQVHFGEAPEDGKESWGDMYTVQGGSLVHESTSLSQLSLVHALLGMTGPVEALAILARPGADAWVTLRKFQDPVTLGATITDLELAVVIDWVYGVPPAWYGTPVAPSFNPPMVLPAPGVPSATPVPTPGQSNPGPGTCTSPDPFSSLGGGTCYLGGWLPPGMRPPGAPSTPTPPPSPPVPVPTPPASPTPPPTASAGCTTPDPFAAMGGGVCANGGWTPARNAGPSPTPVPTPPASPTPPPTGSAGCTTPDPFTAMGGGVCANGGWTPARNAGPSPTPVPTPPASPTPPPTGSAGCTTPDPFTAMGGGVCANGGWTPAGNRAASPAPVSAAPTAPTSPPECGEPDPFASIPGMAGICFNGDWTPAVLVSDEGVMRFHDVEGGVWVIEARGIGYEVWPNLPESFQSEGLRVVFEGKVSLALVTVHGIGRVIVLTAIWQQ